MLFRVILLGAIAGQIATAFKKPWPPEIVEVQPTAIKGGQGWLILVRHPQSGSRNGSGPCSRRTRSGDGKGVRTLFRAKLAWSTGPDLGPGLISSGLPAGDDNLMFPHPRPLPRDGAFGPWQGGSRERCGASGCGLCVTDNRKVSSLTTRSPSPGLRPPSPRGRGIRWRSIPWAARLPAGRQGRTTRGQVSCPRREGGRFAGGGTSMFRYPATCLWSSGR
jgi:hypothetical protein